MMGQAGRQASAAGRAQRLTACKAGKHTAECNRHPNSQQAARLRNPA